MAKRGDDLLAACDTFARVANVIDALPDRLPDDRPLRDVMPGAWPTVGDVRKLRDAMVKVGWQPH